VRGDRPFWDAGRDEGIRCAGGGAVAKAGERAVVCMAKRRSAQRQTCSRATEPRSRSLSISTSRRVRRFAMPPVVAYCTPQCEVELRSRMSRASMD
jgi:hypothetical protein